MFTQTAGIASTCIKGSIAIYRSHRFILAVSNMDYCTSLSNQSYFQIPVSIYDRGVHSLKHLTHLLKRTDLD